MRIDIKGLAKLLGVFALLASVGCGGASSNDQGTSVTLLGTFQDAPESGSDDLPAGQTGAIVSLFDGNSASGNEDVGEVGGVLTYLGIQNNLSGQFYRTERVFLDYYIEGSGVQPPQTAMALSTVIGPSVPEQAAQGQNPAQEAGNGSSLPDIFDGDTVPNRTFAQTFVVPPSVMGYLNLNADAIFGARDTATMVVSISVTGLTSAGDRLETNSIQFPVILKRGPVIPPTTGGDDSEEEEEEPAA